MLLRSLTSELLALMPYGGVPVAILLMLLSLRVLARLLERGLAGLAPAIDSLLPAITKIPDAYWDIRDRWAVRKSWHKSLILKTIEAVPDPQLPKEPAYIAASAKTREDRADTPHAA